MIKQINHAMRLYSVTSNISPNEGMTHIALCDETGFFAVSGDFVNFTAVFDPRYRTEDLVTFLRKKSMYNLFTKTVGDKWVEYNFRDVKDTILEKAREYLDSDVIDKEEYESILDTAYGLEEVGCINDWYQIVANNIALDLVVGDHNIHPEKTTTKPMYSRFWNEVWVPFIDALNVSDKPLFETQSVSTNT